MNPQPSLLGASSDRGALFSPCGTYRYRLWRNWGKPAGAAACFVMLNPSTADESVDDRTVRRCIKFSQAWGFDRLHVVNIFALRSTNPDALYDHPAPIGEDNDVAILTAATTSDLVVCAWGNHGEYLDRGRRVYRALVTSGVRPTCFQVSKAGHPVHPLYQHGSRQPVRFTMEISRG